MVDKYKCDDCKGPPDFYMVHDSVWKSATSIWQGNLCLRCLEVRLKRKFSMDDFTTAPINNGIRLGYQMGLEE